MENGIDSFEEYGNQLENNPLQEMTSEKLLAYGEMIKDAKKGCMIIYGYMHQNRKCLIM